jgi:mannose-6-phosphate isomerase-like protein (cupin superfamily)
MAETLLKAKKLRFGQGFRVIFGNARAQVAQMVIAPGEAEGDPHNRHRGADQWLYVVSGSGRALVNGKRVPLSAGVMLLIERRDRHEVRNTGRTPLKTLNYYSPPAYTAAGDELPSARD